MRWSQTPLPRTRVSYDNPYSEFLFFSIKYWPDYPNRLFRRNDDPSLWMAAFVVWYNYQHCRSAIQFVTPDQCQNGQADELCSHSVRVYEQAREQHPRRWSRCTSCWRQPEVVWIYPQLPEIVTEPAGFVMPAWSVAGETSFLADSVAKSLQLVYC
jgi:hypothetical protein